MTKTEIRVEIFEDFCQYAKHHFQFRLKLCDILDMIGVIIMVREEDVQELDEEDC